MQPGSADAPQNELHEDEKHVSNNTTELNASHAHTQNIATDSRQSTRDPTSSEPGNTQSKKRKQSDDAPEQTLPAAKRLLIEETDGSGRSTPSSTKKARALSPPWKKVAAEGPTAVFVDGKRKSTRTNVLPSEPSPEPEKRRPTRGSLNPAKNEVDYFYLNKGKPARGRGRGGLRGSGRGRSKAPQASTRGRAKDGRSASTREARDGAPASDHRAQNKTPVVTKRGDATPQRGSRGRGRAKAVAPTHSMRGRRRRGELNGGRSLTNGHHDDDSRLTTPPPTTNGHDDAHPLHSSGQRLRLRFKLPNLRPLHPDTVPKPRKYSSFTEWLADDDPLEGEKEGRYTQEEAEREAEVRLRILTEAEPGGLLSKEKLSLYLPDKQDEDVPAVYGSWDHITAHALHFRVLLQRERRSHILDAKRTATACQNKLMTDVRFKTIWNNLQTPLTADEIKEQEIGYQLKRYKQLVRDLELRWELAKAEVNKIRLERWQEEQQRRGRQVLDEMLDKSTALLDQRRYRASSELESGEEDSEEEGYEDETANGSRLGRSRNTSILTSTQGRPSENGDVDEGGSEGSDPDNMSSSDDEEDDELADADEDANLSPEALRRKYAGALERGPSPWDDTEDEVSVEQEAEDIIQDEDRDEESEAEHDANDVSLSAFLNGGRQQNSPKDSPELEDHASDIGHADSGYSTLDPAIVEVEEVDPALLDDTEDSGSATEEDSDEDDNSQDELDADDGEDDGEDDEEEDEDDLWGFFSKAKRQEIEHEVIEEVEQGSEANAEVKEENNEMHSAIEQTERELDQGVEPADEELSIEDLHPTTNGAKPRIEIPTVLLRGTLREYQHDGLDWLAGLYANDTNGILADEMGLGKTIQTISLLAHLAVHHEIWGPHLVVVPTSVILNWEMEFKKWCPGFKILTYYGTQDERKKKRSGWMNDDKWNVVITSYQLILQDAQAFKKRGWHYLILDEAHNIKNFQTQRWQTLLTFRTHARLLLTGTPLQNNLSELWSLMFFLMPTGIDGSGGFAELEHFINATRRPADQILEQGRQKLDAQAQAAVNKLHEVLRPYLLRRLKADVEKQMPLKYEHVVYCRLSKRQRQLYDTYMGRADTRETLSSGNYMSIINCLMNLRKVCNHPDLFETRQIVTSFTMPKSAVASYEIKELLVRKRLLEQDPMENVSLDALGLNLIDNEHKSATELMRARKISAVRQMEGLVERETRRLSPKQLLNGSTLESTLAHLKAEAAQESLDLLKRGLNLTKQRTQRIPMYGAGLVERLTVPASKFPLRQPIQRSLRTEWFLNTSERLMDMVPSLEERSKDLGTIVQKFGCTTPAVVANDMPSITLGRNGMLAVQELQERFPIDPYHDARIRLSIQFPDKRLLQYDCGKLQRLDLLLRELQARGSRALIFTQMTKVLDILEQFLNIHGHRYLRLDGATKIEQRQILTDRFNNDNRILAFILSSRSGGLGINLTGADTVIFYDLDWNPAMDKQCQDRCHRIGQTRDVHIYRFVSESTIEANILRKSNQKRLLDDVIIQKGEFTTDFFNRVTYRDAFEEEANGDEASAAMDRVLGDVTGIGQVLESVEDKEDATAAKEAQKEMSHIDDEDFNESTVPSGNHSGQPSATPKTSVPPTPREGVSRLETEDEKPHVDDYMVSWLLHELKDVAVKVPGQVDRRKQAKKGRDGRRR